MTYFSGTQHRPGTQGSLPSQAPLFCSRLPPQPVFGKTAAPSDAPVGHEKGILALGIIKTLVGGMVIGGIVATAKRLKFWPMVAIDMVLGIGETYLAKWIINSSNPIAQKILQVSSKLSRGKNKKPVEQMSQHEREMALTPISAIVSIITGLMTYAAGDKLEGNRWLKTKTVTEAEANRTRGLRWFTAWPKAKIHAITERVSIPSAIKNNRLYQFAFTGQRGKLATLVVAAAGLGMLEGYLAEKLKNHEEENERKGKIGFSGLF